MRLGQTSVVYFLSRLLTSAIGFVATIYFARVLGADPLGIYYLVISVVAWLAIAGNIGVSGAITKRVSEGEDQEQFAIAGTSLVAGLFVLVAAGVFVFRPYVHQYIGQPVAGYVVLILFASLGWSLVSSLLSGVHLVHIKGILSPVKMGGQSLLQVAALAGGMGLAGLFLGHVAGILLVIGIGGLIVFRQFSELTLPRRHHYQKLFNYAKFSWLGGLESRMFNYTDIIVLGFFVSSGLIAVYSIAWNIAMFLIAFSGSISVTLFPEMSERSVEDDLGEVISLLEDAISYTGLILIPGLVGSLIIGERLLRIYGDEFTQGTAVLGLLILAALIRAYQKQFLNTLNAIDRPDLSFHVNALFVVANLFLNVILVYLYGWVGAAVATTLSVSISLLFGYYYLTSIHSFAVLYTEIGRQMLAALLMGAVVYGGLWIENTHRLIRHNFATVLILVGIGAGVYFFVLLGISAKFRRTVSDNLPTDVPLLAGRV